MTSTNDDVNAEIALFSRSNQPSDLRALVSMLDQLSFPVEQTATTRTDQKRLLLLWLQTLATVDAVVKNIRADKIPVTAVAPPPGKDGRPSPYMPGVRPEAVSDPEVRERYEAAIAENAELATLSKQHRQIASAQLELNAKFTTWARGRFKNDPKGTDQVIKAARSAGCSPARIKMVASVISGSRGL